MGNACRIIWLTFSGPKSQTKCQTTSSRCCMTFRLTLWAPKVSDTLSDKRSPYLPLPIPTSLGKTMQEERGATRELEEERAHHAHMCKHVCVHVRPWQTLSMRTIFYIFDYKNLFDIAGISRLLYGERLQDKTSSNFEANLSGKCNTTSRRCCMTCA